MSGGDGYEWGGGWIACEKAYHRIFIKIQVRSVCPFLQYAISEVYWIHFQGKQLLFSFYPPPSQNIHFLYVKK